MSSRLVFCLVGSQSWAKVGGNFQIPGSSEDEDDEAGGDRARGGRVFVDVQRR
jgi:hypothetical protein